MHTPVGAHSCAPGRTPDLYAPSIAQDAEAIDARSLRGTLSLTFVRDRGRTVVRGMHHTPPLHLQRLLYLDRERPALARATLLNGTAGLFAGDRLCLEIRAGAGAAVELTTPTMTRAFGMRDGHAEVITRLTAAVGSYLEYLPEPVILCRDAALHQRTDLEAEAGAIVAVGEVLSFGRGARGERHAYRELRQRTEVCYDGRPVLVEGLYLTSDHPPTAPGVLGPYQAYGTLQLLAGAGQSERLLPMVRDVLATRPDIPAGASLLATGAGVAVRVLGDAPSAVQSLLRTVVTMFRSCCFPA